MLTGDSVFVISCVKFASSPFAQEVLFGVSLLITLLSRFGGVRHLVTDFLLYKVVSEVVEVARRILRSPTSRGEFGNCFDSLWETLFVVNFFSNTYLNFVAGRVVGYFAWNPYSSLLRALCHCLGSTHHRVDYLALAVRRCTSFGERLIALQGG